MNAMNSCAGGDPACVPHRRGRAVGPLLRLLAAAVIIATADPARAGDATVVTISSEVARDYTRTRLPDGSFKPETYSFGEGGRWDGGMRDDSVTSVPFLTIARTLARPLAEQGYVPSTSARTTDLMILVYWGTTSGTRDMNDSIASVNLQDVSQRLGGAGEAEKSLLQSDQASALSMLALENRMRDMENARNARILGFSENYDRAMSAPHMGFARDTISELETNRYFVVLMAFDFQTARKEKKLKCRWVTRMSIVEQGNRFDEQLLAMARKGAPFFGQDSRGLIRDRLREPVVRAGEPQVIEVDAPAPVPRK